MDFTEINKLHEMLTKAEMPHTFEPLFDGFQIRVYSDETHKIELDDAIIHNGSHGHQNGLLETYSFGGCSGWETAEQVFDGWSKMYRAANEKKVKTCDCTVIGAGGETWEGSAPSWD